MKVYYNEFDKKKCAALSHLMKDGYIRKGEIDDRSIHDVQPDEIREYERCHFFAGIGLWDHALDLARWPEGDRVWTGSCPCQPFSTAGRQKGKADDRHLWPEWERLIRECSPATVFGEQVANAVTKGWLDDVYQGLEAKGYAVGSAVLPACSVGAPHKRDRLWFVGNSEHDGSSTSTKQGGSETSILDNAQRQDSASKPERAGEPSGLAFPSFWQSGAWIDCPDGKQRLIEPRISLLANGYPERVGVLHCAGDAIVPQVAAEFITAFKELKE